MPPYGGLMVHLELGVVPQERDEVRQLLHGGPRRGLGSLGGILGQQLVCHKGDKNALQLLERVRREVLAHLGGVLFLQVVLARPQDDLARAESGRRGPAQQSDWGTWAVFYTVPAHALSSTSVMFIWYMMS